MITTSSVQYDFLDNKCHYDHGSHSLYTGEEGSLVGVMVGELL